jgi:DNA-binding NarL/FixJ family response regulator
MKFLLAEDLGAEQVREAESLDEAIEILTNEGAGDLVLVDLKMPGMSGAEALTALRDGFPSAKIAVVSAWEERADIISALSAGVHGYVPKSLPGKEMAAALRSILEGRIFVPASLGQREAAPAQLRAGPSDAKDKLTARQRDVLAELLKGLASKEIARKLNIAEGTVKIHLAAIYRALGVRTRAEAIATLSRSA